MKDLTFKTGFKSGNVQIEIINGKEYLCIGDFQREKCIVLHPLDGKKQLTVDLSNLDLFQEKIMAFEILDLDTILVLPYYSTKIYCLNRTGDVWKIIDLKPYLPKDGKYELKRSATPFHYQNNTLIFSLEYVYTNENDIYSFRQKRNAAPILFKVEDIFADSLKVSYGLDNLYNNFSDANHVNIEGNNFVFFKDKIVFNSAYSDSLYIINPVNFKIQTKIKLHSKYSKINIRPVTNQQQSEEPSIVNSNFRTNGQIRSVKYYKKKDVYFVFASHKPQQKERNWSIIILDKNFNQIDEILMDSKKHAHYGLISEQGILISSYYETLWDSDTNYKNTYALFDFL
ncbi:hypothetical protein [Tenacibaculum sp. MAR_2009_124]|uniref:hypothetical protein n=1 Tax=Tenacibaculum sp. MAR_2009_124 TaxID=1250059 RepID=UPI000B86AED1|nr:hypothetical protein [Tenacibaculum sp. MAR_2009_124]